jgi:hypothetical protein
MKMATKFGYFLQHQWSFAPDSPVGAIDTDIQ